MLNNLKIRTKISILAVIMMVFTCAIGYVGYYNLSKANANMNSMYKDRLVAITLLEGNIGHARAVQADILEVILNTNNNSYQQTKLTDISTRAADFNKNFETYKKMKLDSFEVEMLPKLESNLATYREKRKEVLDLATAGKQTEAEIAYDGIMPVMEAFQKNLADLADFNVKTAESINNENQRAYVKTITAFLIILLVSVLISILITYVISKSISNPIVLAINHIKEIAGYNISTDVPKTFLNRRDEVGDLAKAIQVIEENLRDMIGQINITSDSVAASAEELTATSEEISSSSQEVAQTIDEIAKGASDQAENTTAGAESLMDLGNIIEADIKNINAMSLASSTVANLVSEGLELAAELNVKTKENSMAASIVFESILKTNENSTKISEASNLISAIAGQTNLLALNAAIEAARAGEHGKGFAVVADEIRKLAEQSTNSTKKIDEVVAMLIEDAATAVKKMEEAGQIVQEQEKSVKSTEAKFNEISIAIKKAEEAVGVLLKASTMMENKKNDVMDKIEALSAAAEENAAGTEQAAASMEEQTSAMSEIANASTGLAELSSELQELIRRFKL